MEDYIIIGKTQKPHGLGGELRFLVEDRYVEDFDETDVVFLKVMGKPLPYFIESVRVKNGPLIKFEDVNSPEDARLIASCEMMMKASSLQTQDSGEEETMAYLDLVGFEIVEQTLGTIGVINSIEEYPQQIMAIVDYQGREVLIPLNEHFVQEINEVAQKVYMELPEGLLDV